MNTAASDSRHNPGRHILGAAAVGIAAKGYVALLNLCTMPFILRSIGAETYGLFGIVAIAQAFFSVLDTGVGGAVTRKVAVTLEPGPRAITMLASLKYLGRLYWLAVPAFIVFGMLVTSAIAGAGKRTAVQFAIAALVGFQWPFGFYSAVLNGRHRQQLVSVITAVVWSLRLGLAIAVLMYRQGAAEAFFLTQAVVVAGGAALMAWLTHREVREWKSIEAARANIRQELGAAIASMIGVALLTLFLNQIDKLAFANLFELIQVGYYTFAWQLAGVLYLVYNPLYLAFLPSIAKAQASGDAARMAELGASAASIMAGLIGPALAVVMIEPRLVLFAWTGDAHTSASVSPYLPPAFVAATAGALCFVALAIQQAADRTNLSVKLLLIADVVLTCALLAIALLGPQEVRVAWAAAIVGVAYCLASLFLTCTRVLSQKPVSWLTRNVLVYPAASVAIVSLLVVWMPEAQTRLGHVVELVALLAGALVAALAVGAMLLPRFWARPSHT